MRELACASQTWSCFFYIVLVPTPASPLWNKKKIPFLSPHLFSLLFFLENGNVSRDNSQRSSWHHEKSRCQLSEQKRWLYLLVFSAIVHHFGSLQTQSLRLIPSLVYRMRVGTLSWKWKNAKELPRKKRRLHIFLFCWWELVRGKHQRHQEGVCGKETRAERELILGPVQLTEGGGKKGQA